MTVDLLEGKGMCSFLPLHQKHPMSPASPIEEVCVCVCVSHSVASDSFQPRTVAHQAPLSVEFSRQEYWSGLPFPSPGDLPDPGIEPMYPVSPPLVGRFFTTEPRGKPHSSPAPHKHTTDHLFPPPGIKCPPFPLRTPLSSTFSFGASFHLGPASFDLSAHGPPCQAPPRLLIPS